MRGRSASPIFPVTWSWRDLWRVPGLLSLSRVLLAALFPLALGRPWWALGLLAAAGATDLLDGWYARRFHEESSTGAALDGLTDKIFVLAVVVTLLLTGSLSLIETLLLGTRDIGEIALALRLRLSGRPVFGRPANLGGKVATLFQYAALVAILFGSAHRVTLIGAAALAGILATAAYWQRDVVPPEDDRSIR